jgi:peroxiredoxin
MSFKFAFMLAAFLFSGTQFTFADSAPACGTTSCTAGKVANSEDLVRPLIKGAMAPDGLLQKMDGKEVHLKDLLQQKRTVLIFYRGSWCPYCNMHLYKLQSIESDLHHLGYQILAVTPDNVAHLKDMSDRNKLTYTLLSDRSMKLTEAFGLAYKVGPDMMETLKKYGHDLDASTGNSLHELPVPAAYVINREGKILYSYYDANFTKRVNPEALLTAAKINSGK